MPLRVVGYAVMVGLMRQVGWLVASLSPHKKSFRTIFFLICEKIVKNFVKNLVVSEKRCTFAPANAARDA